MHSRFLRRAIGFAGIARNTGANNIFPCRRAAAVARDDMVEIQILALKNLAAVLAHVFIALKNVVPREFDFLLWQSIEHDQQDHARHPDAKGDGLDRFRMRFAQ